LPGWWVWRVRVSDPLGRVVHMFDPDIATTDTRATATATAAAARGLVELDAWRDRLAAELDEIDSGDRADPFCTPLYELAAVDGVHDRWCAGDATDVELRAVALAAERTRRALDALSLDTLAELDARGVTDRVDGMRTGAWLARESGVPAGVATRRVRLATKLRAHLPEVADALAESRIGVHHAQVLADAANPRIVDEFAVVAPALIDLAAQMPFDAWRREVAGVAELLDDDGGHRPPGDLSENTARMHRGVANTWILHAELSDELGLPIHEALQATANRLFHALQRDEDTTVDLRVPSHSTILAMALAELAATAQGHDPTTAPRPEVSLVVNAADPDHVTDTDGVAIGDTHAATLLCDPVFRAVSRPCTASSSRSAATNTS
jgi:Domain of unknown function (DUF222)